MIISIEGNIGSGKTTVCAELERRGHDVVYEPVEQFQETLERFYEAPRRYAFCLQCEVVHAIAEAWEGANDNFFTERSVLTTMNVFAKDQYNENLMTFEQWCRFQAICGELVVEPDMFIYIKVPCDVALDRIRRRNRPGEEHITLEFLQRLENLHDEWLEGCAIVVDGDRPTGLIVSEIISKVYPKKKLTPSHWAFADDPYCNGVVAR